MRLGAQCRELWKAQKDGWMEYTHAKKRVINAIGSPQKNAMRRPGNYAVIGEKNVQAHRRKYSGFERCCTLCAGDPRRELR